MAFDFTGKTAIVTGGAGGIGSEIAKGIVEGGGHVVVTDINEEADREFVSSLGEGSHFYKLNIADADEVRSTVGRIVSDIPGSRDLILPGETGLLAPAQDPEALAKAILWMLEHPEERRAMGRLGRERIARDFSPERYTEIFADLFRSLAV